MATVIDASGHILGRLASHVAKRLIEGDSVVIVNSEKTVITGSREHLLDEFKNRRSRGTQRFGPYYPRVPHLMVKRAVRGMIPYQTPRGRDAFRRLRVELGLPAKYLNQPLLKVPAAQRPVGLHMTIGELSKDLGAAIRTQPGAGAPKAAPKPRPEKAAPAKKVKA